MARLRQGGGAGLILQLPFPWRIERWNVSPSAPGSPSHPF